MRSRQNRQQPAGAVATGVSLIGVFISITHITRSVGRRPTPGAQFLDLGGLTARTKPFTEVVPYGRRPAPKQLPSRQPGESLENPGGKERERERYRREVGGVGSEPQFKRFLLIHPSRSPSPRIVTQSWSCNATQPNCRARPRRVCHPWSCHFQMRR